MKMKLWYNKKKIFSFLYIKIIIKILLFKKNNEKK